MSATSHDHLVVAKIARCWPVLPARRVIGNLVPRNWKDARDHSLIARRPPSRQLLLANQVKTRMSPTDCVGRHSSGTNRQPLTGWSGRHGTGRSFAIPVAITNRQSSRKPMGGPSSTLDCRLFANKAFGCVCNPNVAGQCWPFRARTIAGCSRRCTDWGSPWRCRAHCPTMMRHQSKIHDSVIDSWYATLMFRCWSQT